MLPLVAQTASVARTESRTRSESKQKLLGSKDRCGRRAVAGSKASRVCSEPQQEASAPPAEGGPGQRLMTPVASCVGVAEAPMSPPLRANVWWTDDPDAKLGKHGCLSLWQAEQEENDVQDMPSLPLITPAVSIKPQDAEQSADGEGPQVEERELLVAAPDKYRLVGNVTVAELQVMLEWPGRGKYDTSMPKVLQAARGIPEDKEQIRLPPGLRGTEPPPKAAKGRLASSVGLDRAASGRMARGLRRVPSLPDEDTGMSSSGTRWHVARRPTQDLRRGLSPSPKGRRKRRDDLTGAIAISRRESDMRRQWMLEDPDYMSWRISELKDANVRARVASSSPGEDVAAGAPDRAAWAPLAPLAGGLAGGASPPRLARRRAHGSGPLAAPPPVASTFLGSLVKKSGDHVSEARQLAQSLGTSSEKLRVAQQGEAAVKRNSFSNTVASAFHFHSSKGALGKMLDRTSVASAGSAPGRSK